MKRPRLSHTVATGTSSTALTTAAATTGTPWLYGLAGLVAALPWISSLTWRTIFATQTPAVRRDLLELSRIEQEG